MATLPRRLRRSDVIKLLPLSGGPQQGYILDGRLSIPTVGGPHGRRHSDDLLYLWLARHERSRGLAGGDPPGSAGGRTWVRRHLVGRTSLLRLFVLPRQHAVAVVSGAALHACGPRHGGDHPAVERSTARGGEGVGARSAEQWARQAGARARPGTARVRRVPRHHGRLARTLRRGVGDDPAGFAHRLHRGPWQVLSAAKDRDPPAPGTQLRGAHLCGRLQRGLDRGGRAAEGADADVRGSAVAGCGCRGSSATARCTSNTTASPRRRWSPRISASAPPRLPRRTNWRSAIWPVSWTAISSTTS